MPKLCLRCNQSCIWADALRCGIEACITREGTDYGMQDVPLATKVCQVQHQLDRGPAVSLDDIDTDSCTIQATDQRAAPPSP